MKYTEEQYNELNNKYLLALADMENMRKNFVKKQAELNAYKYEEPLKDMLDILDDIDRSLLNGDVKPTSGVALIFAKFVTKLYKYGLKRFEPEKGEEFNSDEMEAISVVDSGKEQTNKVIECTLVGYKYNDKIIRYPKVVVGA